MKRAYYLRLHDHGRLKPVAFVIWLVTHRCNLTCTYCEASSGEEIANELSHDQALRMIDDLKRAGVSRLLLSGGEPLMRPDIWDLLDYLDRVGLTPGLISNGYLIQANWEEIKRHRYFFFQTSIDGIPSFHDYMRGRPGAFERAMNGLELFGRLRTPMRIVNTVVHEKNLDQLDEMFGHIKRSAATQWQLTPMAKVGRAADAEWCLDREGIARIIEFVERNKRTYPLGLSESHAYLSCINGHALGYPFFCGAGLTRCSIMPDGEVLGCNQVYDYQYSEGNVKERSFSDIWENEFKIFRKRDFREECAACVHLNRCQGGCWVEWCTRKSCYWLVYHGEALDV
jgi:radical SAM protein with 4Fe4S-binding SPASM domain